jgi:hypothetical protein
MADRLLDTIFHSAWPKTSKFKLLSVINFSMDMLWRFSLKNCEQMVYLIK